jgi:hypothetical protein
LKKRSCCRLWRNFPMRSCGYPIRFCPKTNERRNVRFLCRTTNFCVRMMRMKVCFPKVSFRKTFFPYLIFFPRIFLPVFFFLLPLLTP